MVSEKQIVPKELSERTKEVINSTKEAIEYLLKRVNTAPIHELVQNLYDLQEVTRTRRTVVIMAYILAAEKLEPKYGFMRSEEKLGRIMAEILEYLENGIQQICKSRVGRDERIIRSAIASHLEICQIQFKQLNNRNYRPLLE